MSQPLLTQADARGASGCPQSFDPGAEFLVRAAPPRDVGEVLDAVLLGEVALHVRAELVELPLVVPRLRLHDRVQPLALPLRDAIVEARTVWVARGARVRRAPGRRGRRSDRRNLLGWGLGWRLVGPRCVFRGRLLPPGGSGCRAAAPVCGGWGGGIVRLGVIPGG